MEKIKQLAQITAIRQNAMRTVIVALIATHPDPEKFLIALQRGDQQLVLYLSNIASQRRGAGLRSAPRRSTRAQCRCRAFLRDAARLKWPYEDNR